MRSKQKKVLKKGQKIISSRIKSNNSWLGRGIYLIRETILVLWVVACLLISLIQFGLLGIQLMGSAYKVPPQIEFIIIKSDQWLNQYVWRAY